MTKDDVINAEIEAFVRLLDAIRRDRARIATLEAELAELRAHEAEAVTEMQRVCSMLDATREVVEAARLRAMMLGERTSWAKIRRLDDIDNALRTAIAKLDGGKP